MNHPGITHVAAPIVRPLLWWAQESQRRACRNAMVASTALAERRHERRDVEEYLEPDPRRTLPHSPPARAGRAGSTHG